MPSAAPTAPHLTILMGGFSTLVAACILALLFASWAETQDFKNTRWEKERVQGIVDALPSIARSPDPVVIFLGSSDIESSIQPLTFDSLLEPEVGPVRSYNLAVRDFSKPLPTLVDRIVEEWSESGKKIAVAVVKVTPSRLTARADENYRLTTTQEIEIGQLHSSSMFLRLFEKAPARAAHLFFESRLFAGHSPDEATSYLYDSLSTWLTNAVQRRVVPSRFRANLQDLWYNPRFKPSPAWDPVARGGFFFGAPASNYELARMFQTYELPYMRAKILAFHDECCDFTELRFSEALVVQYMAAARRLSLVADKVYLLYFPDRPSVRRAPDTKERLAVLLERLSVESGIELLDFSKTGGFQDADYFDVIHLNQAGISKLERLLATELARKWGRQ
jgi:hypothetical protein